MTRDDLYGYYRRYYVPNNATLVDRRRRRHRRGAAPRRAAISARIQPGAALERLRTVEPEQTGERRVTIRKEGHDGVPEGRLSRAGGRPIRDFFPLLVLDAVLTGAKGLNLWSSFRDAAAAAQRAAVSRARRARPRVVGVRRAAADRAAVPLHGVGDRHRRHAARVGRGGAARGARPRARATGITDAELAQGEGAAARAAGVRQRQRHQHRAPARLLRDDRQRRRCSPALPARIAAVTLEEVADAARARARRRRTAPSAGSIRCRSARKSDVSADVDVRTAGLEPRLSHRAVLDNGVVVLAQGDARRRRRSPISLAMRAGSICDPPDAPGATWLLSRVIDRGTDDAIGRRHRRGARQPRHHADDHRHAPSVLARLHLPRRGLRAGARAARRHRHVAVAAGGRARDAQGRGHHRDPAGRGQPGGPRHRGADGAAVSGRPSVRPPHEGHRSTSSSG